MQSVKCFLLHALSLREETVNSLIYLHVYKSFIESCIFCKAIANFLVRRRLHIHVDQYFAIIKIKRKGLD